MIRIILLSTAMLVASLSQGVAAMKAQEFVEKAAIGGMFEVQSGQLAAEQAQDPGIKDFAQEMVNDHKKANEELKSIAQKQGLSVPSEMDKEHKQKLDKLRNADDFRSTYVPMQQKAHRDTIALFQTYAKEGDNAELKQFAQSTLTVLTDHHEDIEALAGGAKMTN